MGDSKIKRVLEKADQKLQEVQVELEVKGVFCLPESWKTEADSAEVLYQVTALGVTFANGKVRKRELTEEEIKQAEEAKTRKKDSSRKKAESPTPGQVEEQRKIQKLKEEEEARKKAEWDLLDEETKFYRTMEDIYQHPCISWESETPSEEDTRIIKTYTLEKTKSGIELNELEDQLEDHKGVYCQVSRLPNEEESKKKPKKSQDEITAVNCIAWLDLTGYLEPGREEVEVRSKLVQEEPDEEVDLGDCYLYLRLKISPPLTPLSVLDPLPSPLNLVPPQSAPPKLLCSKEASHNFRRQVKLASKFIATEYQELNAEHGENMRKLTVTRQKELRDMRREKFLHELNLSGKAEMLKKDLRKSIVEIIREKLRKNSSIEGIGKIDKEKLLSELYAFLNEQMYSNVDQIIHEKKDQFHEDIVIPRELASRERETALNQTFKENPDARLKRLAFEYETLEKYQHSKEFHLERICRDPKNKNVWLEYTRFALRRGEIARAEENLREIINSEPLSEELVLTGSLMLQRRRFNEASYYIHMALEKDFHNITGNLVASLMYKLGGISSLEKKYYLISKRLCMRHLGMLPPKKGTKSNPTLDTVQFRPSDDSNDLTTDQEDDMHYILVDYFIREKLIELASRALEQIKNKDTSVARFKYYSAEILYWKGEFKECVQATEELLKLELSNSQAWKLQGFALFRLNRGFDAEESLLKAVKFSQKSARPASHTKTSVMDISVLLKLGSIYLQRRAWSDAKLIFSKCCEESPTAISWHGLGLSCIHLGETASSEEALNQANILDPKNPYAWAALALLCLKASQKLPGRFTQYKLSLSKAFEYGIDEPNVLISIAQEYLRKFYLEGDDLECKAMDVSDPLVCYSKASEFLKAKGKPVDDLCKSIDQEFQSLKSQSNQVSKIEESRQLIIQAVNN